jgi:hypothetical protein
MLHKDFRALVQKQQKAKNDYLFKPIRKIYNRFKTLPPNKLKAIIASYKINTAIQELCLCKKKPRDYEWLNSVDRKLSGEIKKFCTNLYEHVLPKTDKRFNQEYGTLSDYYYALLEANKPNEVCPFCGLIKLKSKTRKVRDAFDHYFPKGLIPFSSIHLLNLLPTCNDCNSYCKKEKIPSYCNGIKKRRKSFFPFGKTIPNLKIGIELKHIEPFDYSRNLVSFSFGDSLHKQEIETWRYLYNIDERYEAELKSSDAKAWLEEFENHIRLNGKNKANEYFVPLRKNKLNNRNFIRIPFIEECIKQNILST